MRKIAIIASAITVIITACAKKSIEEIAPSPPKAQTVVVTPNTPVAKTTYIADIKPIIDAQCVSCHGANAQYPDCSTYTAVKAAMDAANGATILSRMNLLTGNTKFMPQGGSKVQADVDKITKWQTDGLLEQ